MTQRLRIFLVFMRIPYPVSSGGGRWPVVVLGLLSGLLLGGPVGPASAQGSRPPTPGALDSLTRAVAQAPPDTTRLRLIGKLVVALRQDWPAAAEQLEQGRQLAHRLGDRQYEALFLTKLADLAIKRFDYVRAVQNYQEAIRLAQAGLAQPPTPAHDRARRSLQIVLALAEIGLSDIAGAEDDFLGASNHGRRALRWASELPVGYPRRLSLLAEANTSLLKAYTFRVTTAPGPPPDSLLRPARAYAEASKQVALEMRQQGKEQMYLGITGDVWTNESDLYARQGQLDSAMALNRRALGYFQQLGLPAQVVTIQQHLVNQQMAVGNYAAAIVLARQTQQLAHQIGMGLVEADCLSSMAVALSKTGDLAGAYRASHRALLMRDSLLSADKRQAIADLEVRYDTREKESRIQALTQRQRIVRLEADRATSRARLALAAAAALLIGLLAVGGFYVRLRQTQQRLKHLTQIKDQLFAIIGHDLRAPVAALRQAAPLLHRFAADPDPVELTELATAFDTSSGRLAALLDNLLNWGLVQTQALALRPEPTQLAVLLADEARAVAAIAAAKNLRVVVDVPAPLPPLLTDPTLLRVVVQNLLSNALKYTRASGTITLFAHWVDAPGAGAGAKTGIAVGVRDTGVGMTTERLLHILSPETRTSTRGTAGEQGTGLGLRVAAAFARELGSQLTGASRPGLGTTLSLTLLPETPRQ